MWKFNEFHGSILVFICLIGALVFTEYRKRHPVSAPEAPNQVAPLATTPSSQTGPVAVEQPISKEQPKAKSLAALVPETIPSTYVVQAGDTLEKISKQTLGSILFIGLIHKKNSGLAPKHLQIGQKLVMPARKEVLEAAIAIQNNLR